MSLSKGLARLLYLLIAGVAPLTAQFNLGTITGQVLDPHGAAASGCRVTVTSLTNDGDRIVSTNSLGFFTVSSLPADSYNVAVESPGFKREVTKVTLDVDQTVTANFQLKLGNVSETVQVTATTSALELSRDSYEVSHLVNTQDLQDLPSAARSFIAIASQGPGQAAATDVPAGPMITFGRDADEMIVGGQAVGSTTFLQDGVVNMNLLTGTANIVPSIESIQEVSVESNGMSARFTSPGLINVISKRGTNRIHGTAYDYFGNTVLNARNFFATTLAPQVYNEFGANLGAPILKNKLFAFFDYSGRRSNNPTTNRDRVPTAAELQGNFQGEATIYDPLTYSASAGTITAFPNNTIPTSRISNYATLFSPYFPAANIPLAGGVNYIANLNAPSNTDHYSGRLDYVLSSKDTLSGQIQMDFAPAKTSVVWPEYDLLGNIGGTNAYLQDIHIFTANVINIARMGYNRSIVIIGPLVEGTQNFVQAYGLQNLNLPADQSVPPTSTITGVNSFGYPQYPMGGKQNLFQWADEVNWTMGQHQFFFGAELQRMQFNGVWQAYNGGGYSFTGEFTSNHKAPLALGPGMADFLLGYPTTATGGQGVPEGAFRSSNVAGYIQDNWKLTRKLTLNLGVRYEFFNAPADKWGHDTIFNLPTSSYLHEPWTPDYTNFSPRAGFAYSLTRNTVIRSGFGIYYATEPYQFLNYMVESPQYYVLQSITENYLATPVPVTNAFSANPTSSALAITSVGSRMPTPYTEQWNIGVQQAFGPRLMATVSYVGSASHHQSERFDPNQAFQENPAQPTALATRRPFPAVGDVTEQLNIGNASYNSLQSTLQYRLRHGLSVQASYTFSKTLDLSDAGATTPVNSQDLHGSYGVANFGRAQVFNATYVYELPFGNNQRFLNNMGWFSKQVAGGWNISGITSKYTGIPFEIVEAADLSSTGTGAHIQVPNRVCNGNLPSGQRTLQMWFNTSCFTQPTAGLLGNEGRNPLVGPGNTNFNLSAYKRFPFGEQRWVQFRADFFNAFNHPGFAMGPQPNLQSTQTVGASTFGQVTTAGSPRIIELSLKVAF